MLRWSTAERIRSATDISIDARNKTGVRIENATLGFFSDAYGAVSRSTFDGNLTAVRSRESDHAAARRLRVDGVVRDHSSVGKPRRRDPGTTLAAPRPRTPRLGAPAGAYP